jgi:periplasmic protein TonB
MNAGLTDLERPPKKSATLVLELEPTKSAPETPLPAQGAGEYKKHSLAAGYWGDLAPSKEPVRRVTAAEAQQTFLRGFLEMPTEHDNRNPIDLLISAVIHVLIVAVIVIAPLLLTQTIDLRHLELTYLTMPRPPAAPSPPASVVREVRRPVKPLDLRPSTLVAPSAIPSKVVIAKDQAAPEINPGVIGGIPGGESGGVLGGIVGGMANGPAPPQIAAAPKKKTVYRVGGVVKEPQELSVVQPVYPPIARAAHVEGVVIIDAVIDEHGDVVSARALSGPGLLIPAALNAVMRWKYEPTYLDGQPVALQMKVQVVFRLH